MSGLCEHETFKDCCGICHRDGVITRLRADNERLRAENEALLAANRDVMLHWNVLKADYERLRAALEKANSDLTDALTDATHDKQQIAENAEHIRNLRAALRNVRNKRREMDMGDLSADEAVWEADDLARAALAAQPAPSPWRADALVTAANALIDFYNGPVQNKRPDVFQRLMQRLADAFPPAPGKEGA